MDIANILPDQVWSIILEGESDNRFSQLMRKWLDPEFIDDFFEQNYNYIKNLSLAKSLFNKGLYIICYCLFWEFSNFYFPIQFRVKISK